MLLAAATLLVLFGVVDVAAVRSGECGSPRDAASGTAVPAISAGRNFQIPFRPAVPSGILGYSGGNALLARA